MNVRFTFILNFKLFVAKKWKQDFEFLDAVTTGGVL